VDVPAADQHVPVHGHRHARHRLAVRAPGLLSGARALSPKRILGRYRW
jgi:hypothetical protein